MSGNGRYRKMIADGVTSVAVAFLVFFLTESALRILYPEKVLEIATRRLHVQDLAYEYNPEYLVDLKPGISKTFAQAGADGVRRVHWNSNRDGFRGSELQSRPETRVMVYGDSNIQARFSPVARSFAGRLERYLNRDQGTAVEVVNAGVIGFGPDQSLKKFMAQVDRFRPAVVIFHVFADNDFGDIVRNRLFEIGPNGAPAETGFKPAVDPSLQGPPSRLLITRAARKILNRLGIGTIETNPSPDGLSFQNGSAVDVAENIETRMALSASEFEVYTRRQRKRFSHFADHYDIDLALHPTSESALAKIALMEAILEKAAAVASSSGVEFVVLIQPSSRDMSTHLRPNYEDFGEYENYRQDLLTSTIDAICDRLGIRRINLFPVFTENDPESLFFTTENDHWSDKGQDLAARETARYLLETIMVEYAR
ncbi:MAG: hypothetical protein HKN20_00440 [Gemmatimonadetes bacterium]|nr:hypothetical protein [Gemmatimonadota bacterium]